MNEDQKRLFIFVLLAGITIFTWQVYLGPQQAEQLVATAPKATEVAKTSETNSTATVNEVKSVDSEAAKAVENTTITLVNGVNELKLDSFLNVVSFKSVDTDSSFQQTLGNPVSNFKIQAAKYGTRNYTNLQFNFEQSSANTVKGFDPVNKVTLNMVMNEDGRAALNLASEDKLVFRTFVGAVAFDSDKEEAHTGKVRDYILFTNEVERVTVGDDDSGEGTVKWVGIDFNYHLFAFVYGKPSTSTYKVFEGGELYVENIEASNSFVGDLVFAKKDYDRLVKLGDKLELSVDFGFFGIIAVPILRGLQLFYKYVENWGLAIILLTLVIRTITFPFQYKSFKSMKKMQKVQPELQKIREKFKEDPQRLQKETMALFKKSGANPLGGCLPMVAQMPIFFAFYQVLYNAVELVGAPFMFWITDLSIKDPFYVLPVLMGVAMFFQTKLNPSTSADPTQQKVMMFMPVIFCFFMANLPAGLNLYIFVSTVFGIAQQLFVYKTVD